MSLSPKFRPENGALLGQSDTDFLVRQAAGEPNNAVGRRKIVWVMGNAGDSDASACLCRKQGSGARTAIGIETSRRLIEQQDARTDSKPLRDQHTLPLPTRQLGKRPVNEVERAHPRERVGHTLSTPDTLSTPE